MDIKIYKNTQSTFAELRYTKNVQNCEKFHTHDELTITAIENGLQEIFLNKNKQQIKPGVIAIINPNESHYGKNIVKNTTDGYVLYLQKAWCERLQSELFHNTKTFIPLKLSIIEDKYLFNNFIETCKSLLNDLFTIEKDELLIEFISDLFLNYCSFPIPQDNDSIHNDITYANAIKIYLDQHFLEDLSLSQISSFVGLSPFYLIRLFKNQFGIPPHAYTLNKKVHYAKELLQKNNTIAEIALESGFFDQSHLNREFKRIFSITPKEYQKNMMQERIK